MTTLDSILGGYSTQDFVFSPAIPAILENNILTQLLTANRDAAIFNTTLTVEGLASKAAEVERVDTPSQISGQILAEVSQLLGQGEQTLTEENLAAIANLVDGFIPPAREVATVTSRIASQNGASTLNEFLDSASADLNTSAEVLLERSRQANGQQINVHAGNLVQHTSGSIIQRSNGPYLLSTPSAQTTARTIVHQSSYDINIADAHHQEGRVSFHNHESLIQNLGQEATSIQGPRTVAAQNQSLIATETLQTTSNTLQLAAAGEYSIAANEARQSFQEGVTTRAAFAMEQYGSLSPIEALAEPFPAALQDVQGLLNRFTSLEGAVKGLIQVIGVEGSHVRINRGVDYQSSSVEVQITEGVTLSSRAGYVELTAGGVTLRGIPGFDIQPPDELLLAANEIKEGLESINALLNLSQITQDLSLCDPKEIIRQRQEKRERKERCKNQSEQGIPLDRDCEKVIEGIPSGTRGGNPMILTSPSTGTSSGGVLNLPNLPSTNATGPEASRNNFPTVNPNSPPLSPLSAVVAGSQALGGSIDSWLVESTPNIEGANDPPQVPLFNLDQDLVLELAQREDQPDVPFDRLQSPPSSFSELESQVRAASVELPEGLSIPVINDETRLRPQLIPQVNLLESQIGVNRPSLDEFAEGDESESGLDFSTQQARINQLLSRLQIDSSYESLRNYLPPEADLGALAVLNSRQPQQEALDQFVSLISEALIRQQTEQALGPEYQILVNPVVDLLKEGVDLQDIPGVLMNVLGAVDPRLSGINGLVESSLRSINPFNGNALVPIRQGLTLLDPNDPLSLAIAAASLVGQGAVRAEILSALQGGRTSQDVLLAVLQQLGGPTELINDVIGRVSQVQEVVNSGKLSQLIRDRDFTGLLALGTSLDPSGILSSTVDTLIPIVDLFQTLTKIPDLLNTLSEANVPLLSRFNLLLGCLDLIKKIQAVLDLFDGDQGPERSTNALELQDFPALSALSSPASSNLFPTLVFSRLPSSRRLPARVLEFLPLQTQLIRTIQTLPPSLIPQAEPARAQSVLNSEGVLEAIEVTYPGIGYRSDFNNVQVKGSEVSVRVEGGSIQSIEVLRGGVYSSPPKVYINPQPPLSAQLPIPPEVLAHLYRADLDRFSDECFQVPRLTLQNSRLELIQLSGSQVMFSKTFSENRILVKGLIQLLIPTYERLEDGVRLYPYQKENFYTPLIHTAYIQDYNLTSNQGLALLDPANVFYLEDDNQNVGSYSCQDFGVTIIPNVELMYLLA
jgi:hypothetical protein